MKDKDFNIHLSQHRYSLEIVHRYLPDVPMETLEKDKEQYAAPLSKHAVFSKSDKSLSKKIIQIGCSVLVSFMLQR